jgi:hypothetical protein
MSSDQANKINAIVGGTTNDSENHSFPNIEGESKDEPLPLEVQAAEEKTEAPSDHTGTAATGSHALHGPLSPTEPLQQDPSTSHGSFMPVALHQAASLNPIHAGQMVPIGGQFHPSIGANPYAAMALQNAIQNLAIASAVGAQQQSFQLGNIQPSAILTPSMQQAASTFLASIMVPAATIPILQGLPAATAQVMASNDGLQNQTQQQQREVAAMTGFAGQQQQPGIRHPGAAATTATIVPSSASASSDVRNEGLANRSAVPLYLDYDDQALSEYQCLLRKQVELFETRPEDIQGNAQGRNTPIYIGQVGIRCRHCSVLPKAVRPMGTVYYSRTLAGVYQVAQNMAKVHYFGNKCTQIPASTKEQLIALQRTNKRASGGKEYWVDGLKVHGVYEDGKALRFRPLDTGSRGF